MHEIEPSGFYASAITGGLEKPRAGGGKTRRPGGAQEPKSKTNDARLNLALGRGLL